MQHRIERWAGDEDVLWVSVRDAKKREGAVLKIEGMAAIPPSAAPVKTQKERTLMRLEGNLDKLSSLRDILRKDLDFVLWRQKLLQLATDRAADLEECGWDFRLIFGEEEYMDFGRGVLESYGEIQRQENEDVSMQMDSATAAEEGDWWCRGKKKCHRHAG